MATTNCGRPVVSAGRDGVRIGPSLALRRSHDFSKEGERIDTERPRNDKQFDDIDAALTAFVFRHEALRLSKPRGQLLLRDIRLSPGSGQTRADDLVVLGLNPQRRLGDAIGQKWLNRKIRYWNFRYHPIEWTDAQCQTSERGPMAAVTWYAIIRLANGNQQRVTVRADNQINARLMVEAQFGTGSIISGPYRLMRAI
jgi:hypothetical protein